MAAVLIALLIVYAVAAAVAHPSCISSAGPISSPKPLAFCTMYSNYSCCSVEDDDTQQKIYDEIANVVSQDLWDKCSQYVRDLLCQNCSPFAAHVFDFTSSGNARFFPGLCNSYCKDFFYECKDIVKYLARPGREYRKERRSLLRKSLLNDSYAFCKYTKAPDKDYCFPEIETSGLFSGNYILKQVTEEGCMCVREVVSNLMKPLSAVHAGDGTNRLFLGEQSGNIRILHPGQSKTELPLFMNMEHLIVTSYERGLLSMAFHPNYSSNGLFYVSYSKQSESAADHVTRLSEFSVSTENPNEGNVSSERVLLDIQQPYAIHNGGDIFFDHKGYLHATVGDGGKQGDPDNLSQNKSLLNGKTLRIDVNTKSPGKEYGIPEDNPFSDGVEGLPEIFTLGWRNPWRCGVDPGDRLTKEGRGRICCGDVGHHTYEELNLIVNGGNYGWSALEGDACFSKKKQECKSVSTVPNIQKPVFAYDHSKGKCVIGGRFYRGCSSPSLNGYFIYADFSTSVLYKLIFDKSMNAWKNQEISLCGPEVCRLPGNNSYKGRISSFGQDEKGEVYFMSFMKNKSGSLYQIIDPASLIEPGSCS